MDMCWRGDMRGEEGELRRYRRSIVEHLGTYATPESDLAGAEQIVGELLSNVYRYTPGVFCAETEWEPDGGVTLVVHDRGDCFDPWGDEARDWSAEHGRGLGIIRALGGALRVMPAEHGGCTVAVKLPVWRRNGIIPVAAECPQDRPYSRDRHCPRLLHGARPLERAPH